MAHGLRSGIAASMLALVYGGGPALADSPAAMIVLDASGSMWGQIDGINKITIAQDVVADVMGGGSGFGTLGLMAYGHNRKGDCTDIELLVPPASGADVALSIAAQVNGINPRGKTPLTDAVAQAAEVLRSEEEAATVILVTDGLETCDADPCALARQLERDGLLFTAHVVGFGLSREQGAEVACLAEETGGTYFSADNADGLRRALLETVSTIDPEPLEPNPAPTRPDKNLQINVALTADSPPLEEGEISRLDLRLVGDSQEQRLGLSPSQARSVDPGEYTLKALYQGGQAQMDVQVNEHDVSHATLILNAGRADVAPIFVSDRFEFDPRLVHWEVRGLDTDRRFDLFEPEYDQVLGEGFYSIRAVVDRNPKASPDPVEITVTPGDVTEAEVLIPNARFKVTPIDENGAPLPDSYIRFNIHRPNDDGTPGDRVAGKAGARDPAYPLPGNYILLVEDWGIARRTLEVPISLATGETAEFVVTLPADTAAPLGGSLQ